MQMNEQIEEGVGMQRLLQIGYAYFKEPTKRSDLSVFLDRKYEKVLQNDHWTFKGCERGWTRWYFILQLVDVANIIQLQYESFKANVNFIQEFLHIRMPFLTVLDIGKNQIRNIENLTFLDAPNLQYINLIDNEITNITKVLNKLYFKRLSCIQIEGNYIISVDLGRWQVPNQKGNQFNFAITRYYQQKRHVQDISFLFKSKALSFDKYKLSIYMRNSKRITQRKCYKTLCQKFL